MVRYALQRLVLVIPTVLGMTLLIFAMVRLLPGDVVVAMSGGDAAVSDAAQARVRPALGLSDPLPVQYVRYLSGLVSGDMGTSFLSGQPVAQILARAIPITLELAFDAAAFAVLVGVPLGMISAVRPNSNLDFAARLTGLIGLSLPNFWIATLGLLVTSVVFRWIPAVTWIPFFSNPLGHLSQFALPAFALSLQTLAIVMRMPRASVV